MLFILLFVYDDVCVKVSYVLYFKRLHQLKNSSPTEFVICHLSVYVLYLTLLSSWRGLVHSDKRRKISNQRALANQSIVGFSSSSTSTFFEILLLWLIELCCSVCRQAEQWMHLSAVQIANKEMENVECISSES